MYELELVSILMVNLNLRISGGKPLTVITLTTDFGTSEGYHSVMKGVIYNIAPQVKIVDMTHAIPPQNLYAAAFVLEINVFYFPEDSIHVVVVDPGVGTERRAVAGRIGDQYFVAPDNGVLTRVLLRAGREGWSTEFVTLDRPSLWLEDISSTFHGRDIFAPVAAHLANGERLEAMGTPLKDLVHLPIALPVKNEEGVKGEVIYIDHFGNAITNFRREDIEQLNEVKVHVAERVIDGMAKTFGDEPHGTLLALWDSSKYLMVSEFGGLKQIDVKVGDPVVVKGG
jgi:S-adenosylmethionine hydrolase